MSSLPPVATTVHVTEPSVCCATCEQWQRGGDVAMRVGTCAWLGGLDVHGLVLNEALVYTESTFACTEWQAR